MLSETTQRMKGGLRLARWRTQNLGRVLEHRRSKRDDPGASAIVGDLKREGIASRPSSELFGADAALFDAMNAAAQRLWDDAKSQVLEGRAPGVPGGSYGPRSPSKEYKISLLPQQMAIESPFVQLALHERLLEPANRYLGMHALLRTIDLWWDRPTEGPDKETQLWHRDGDDVMNVKVFMYLNDVDISTGPFCFIPGTHPRGPMARLWPAHDAQGRSTDEQMEPAVARSQWRVYTAPAGAVIICDTCGYHKGLKPTKRDRLMLMVQYTSGTPHYPRVLTVSGTASQHGLTPAQRAALGGTG